MFDLILKGGLLLDGSGSEGVPADLAVSGGRIAAIGHDLGPAAQTLDVAGFCVTPGFLDIHRHGDAEVFREGFGHAELRQGLTTILNGNCGLSLAPFGAAHREEILRYLQPITGGETGGIPTGTMDEYLSALEKRPLPLNVGMLVGNGTVRTDVCGYRAEAPEDFTPIHRRLERALAEGAFAISLGLGYAPECFYSTEELIRALAPLDHSGVPIAVHMREEGDMVCEAVEEMITVARALHTPLHISHLKAMGMRNWGKRIPHALELMGRARQEGMDVSCDVYPYTAGSTQLLHILPPDFLEGGTEAIAARLRKQENRELLRERIRSGHDFDNIAQMVGWDNIVLSTLNLPEHQALTGMTVAQAARADAARPGGLRLRASGGRALRRDDDRPHHLRGGHLHDPARPVFQRDLRQHLPDGGSAASPRLCDVHENSGEIRPAGEDSHPAGGGAQADFAPGAGHAPARQGSAARGDGRGH